MKNGFILFLSFSLFLFSIGCTKDDAPMNESAPTPTASVQGDGNGNHDNTQVTSRGTCNCVVTAVSPKPALVDICGDPSGTTSCTVTGCFASVASLLSAGVSLNGGYAFTNTMGEPFQITNVGPTDIWLYVNCGGTTYSNYVTMASSRQLKTDGGCNVSVCP